MGTTPELQAVAPPLLIRLAESLAHGVLGGPSMVAATWRCAVRDRRINCSERARVANLDEVVTNEQFLLLPEDWQQRHPLRPALLETFCETPRFRGTCYRATNWTHLGRTQGRGKLDTRNE